MKLFVICIGIMVILSFCSIGIDIIMGYGIYEAIRNAVNPFKVMDTIEISILLFFVLLFFIESFLSYLRKRKKKMAAQR